MPNIGQLGENFVQGTAAPSADLRIRMRYLREGDLLPASARKADHPQVESVHAVIVLLAYLVGGPQLGVAERVKALWRLSRRPYQSGKSRSPFVALSAGSLPLSPGWEGKLGLLTFGAALTALVEMACKPDADIRELQGFYPQIEASHDVGFAVIRTGEGLLEDAWYEDSGLRRQWPSPLISAAPSVSMTTMSSAILIVLRDQVRESRRMAKKLGVTIPTAEAYKALGYEPPGSAHWSSYPLSPLSPLGSPVPAGNPGGKNAEGIPAPSALSDRPLSLDLPQETEGTPRQRQPRGQVTTGLPSRLQPIPCERRGQQEAALEAASRLFEVDWTELGATRPQETLHEPHTYSAFPAVA